MKKYLISTTAALAFACSTQAATISWTGEQIAATGDSQVLTPGALGAGWSFIEAYTFGSDSVNTTINGVTFTAVNGTGALPGGAKWSDGFNNAFGPTTVDFYPAASNINSSYEGLLEGSRYATDGATSPQNTIILNDLNIGNHYTIQLFVADARALALTRTVQTGVWGSLSEISNTNVGMGDPVSNTGPGTFLTGTFTADALTQSFATLLLQDGTTNVGGQINGYQLLTAVPEPSTYALLAGVLALACAVVNRRRR